ncbi:MAG: Inositol-3-phosphate synthase, partial [Candidatus Scalindua rubra]
MQKRKVGALIVGVNGATANTTIAGTILQKKGLIPGESFKRGMLTEDDCLNEHDLIDQTQIVFGGWDVNNNDAYEAATINRVLDTVLLQSVKEELRKIRPMKAVHTPHDVDETKASDYSKNGTSLQHRIDSLRKDIASFKRVNGLDEAVVIYLGSPLKAQGTGTYRNLEKFKKAITNNDEGLTSGMLYAYAALEENCPFVDFTPNITLETAALLELADVENVPLAGRDGNTGQTLMKTVIGQMLKIRNLKLEGWYSTNILGNNDGKVLSRDEHAEIKMRDKLGVLEPLLGYGDFDHTVNIEYYAPRGDNKEAWDNIDFLGWLDQRISVKINWLGRDSILAAPLILDLIKLVEYAQRIGEKGIQPHLALFFKNPLGTKARGFFDQYM